MKNTVIKTYNQQVARRTLPHGMAHSNGEFPALSEPPTHQTKEIPLTQGKVTLVDAEDYEWLMQWKWYAQKEGSTFYAARSIPNPNGKQTTLRMHQLILGIIEGLESDHRNGNGLDNRRVNLRVCSHQQNIHNSKLNSNNTSGHKGVRWHVRDKKWQASIGIDGKQKHLGYYDNLDDAIAARRAKEQELFGEFARLNVIEE